MSSEWTPEAYAKVIRVDARLMEQAVNDVEKQVGSGEDARFAVGEALRYAGKLQDNLKLLHQRLNRDAGIAAETERTRVKPLPPNPPYGS